MEPFNRKIRDNTVVCGVIGLGYVGLPLARRWVEAGFPVLGFDIDPAKIRKLKKGHSYIRHIPGDWIRRSVKSNRFVPTGDFSRLAEADAIIICVPTPLVGESTPDLSYVLDTAKAIRRTLRKGQLVVLESTTYPGTTVQDVLPILERSGLKNRKVSSASRPAGGSGQPGAFDRTDPNSSADTPRAKLAASLTKDRPHVVPVSSASTEAARSWKRLPRGEYRSSTS